jgi:hypothetical protein
MKSGESMHHQIQTSENSRFSDFFGPFAMEITASETPTNRVKNGGIMKIESLLSISFTS